jgi:hypothetical protein
MKLQDPGRPTKFVATMVIIRINVKPPPWLEINVAEKQTLQIFFPADFIANNMLLQPQI